MNENNEIRSKPKIYKMNKSKSGSNNVNDENHFEFVITEDDLEEDDDNKYENSLELIFSELSDNTLSVEKDKLLSIKQEDTSNDQKPTIKSKKRTYSNSNLTNNSDHEHYSIRENANTSKINISDKSLLLPSKSSNTTNENVIKENSIEQQTNHNHNIQSETKQNTQNNDGDRSEDSIFGELVVAMLKKMPPKKKKNIKKRIMNLLLS